MKQVLLTEQTILPTADISCVVSAKTNFANYHSISITNGSNALIDIMENAIVPVLSLDDGAKKTNHDNTNLMGLRLIGNENNSDNPS